MQTAPEEILSHIFSFVGNNMALYNTCHKFRNILKNNCKIPKKNEDIRGEFKNGNFACISKINSPSEINCALHGAFLGGHIDIVLLLLDLGAYLDSALFYACEGGNLEICRLLLDRGITHYLDLSFRASCKGGHMDIVLLFLDRHVITLDYAFYVACSGGHIDIVLLLLDLGDNIDLDLVLRFACMSGYIDTVSLLLDRGATDLYSARCKAQSWGHMEIVSLLMDREVN